MSYKLKLHIGMKVFQSLRHNQSTLTPEKLKNLLHISPSLEEVGPHMNISLEHLQRQLGISNSNEILTMKPDHVVSKIYLGHDRANRKISFEIRRDVFLKDVLENILVPDETVHNKRIIVEYSSPNIAKPFHMGHLRSTIIGNFISNINKFLGNSVVRLNYLGDWGTQFGMLKLGVEMTNLSPEQIKNDPLNSLYQAYVTANTRAESDTSGSVKKQAREIFLKLEKGDTTDLEHLNLYKKYTIEELNKVYARLGVSFDEINYESSYNARDIQNVISKLEKHHLIQKEPDGMKSILIKNKKVPLIKSDGSMLYLTRDIAAALDRYKKYKFDQMLYVVDNSQSEHFNCLHDVLHKMDLPWAGRIKHVKFGRIRGMSTRKGTAVFLKDILNEAKELMKQSQILSPNTKVQITDDNISDILGISCVIINDLKQRRQKDYDFDWAKVLQSQGDTGVRLQYTHCRLCSLEKQSIKPATICNPELLKQPEVMSLIIHLALFDEVLHKCHFELESAALVVYLFRLCNSINKALKLLKVKDEPDNIAEQRMMLFMVSKEILASGMKILGIQPLKEM